MNRYPMKLIPYLRPMIWGGNGIRAKYNKETDSDCIGESWELTCRSEAQSVIANGEYAGQKLCDVLGCGYDFPLLIKFIDACDKLSVQVHPDDNVTDENGIPLGKTEMWYIIDAEADAHIIYGLSEGTELRDLDEMIKTNNFDKGLKKVHVKPGDCYFIPAGQIHAIGKGILLAEIQQNSDTTYRLYDYGRLDKNGNPRDLHVSEAMKVIKVRRDEEIEKLRYTSPHDENCLADCEKFSCFRFSITENATKKFEADSSFSALIFLEGSGSIVHNGKAYPAVGGDTYYVPEGIEYDIIGNATFLQAKSKG